MIQRRRHPTKESAREDVAALLNVARATLYRTLA